jgi:hypothetical protein
VLTLKGSILMWFEENECLKYWLKVFEQEEEVVVDEG